MDDYKHVSLLPFKKVKEHLSKAFVVFLTA